MRRHYQIKIKNDASLVSFDEAGLVFNDGSRLDADLVVFCTGFENDVREQAVNIVGPRTGELLADYFDTDEEGEIIGAWKPQRRKWFFFSTYLPATSMALDSSISTAVRR